MAKDVQNKPTPNGNTDSTSPTISDQQKVPPLRIVLNTSGNQKSSSTAVAVTADQSQDLKRSDRPQNAKTDTIVKTGGRVRIKLGTNKQQVGKSNSSGDQAVISNKAPTDDPQKQKIADKQDNNNQKEEINASFSHLRRITRRSQRSAQTVSNEDEESISSMTSTDENLNTTSNNNSDTAETTAASSTSTSTANQSGANNGSANSETPRRYKRRKGETSESQPCDLEGPFNIQSYKLPIQNSFELYKNIRKQVDKKLKNLISIHPKTPYGFRDYMLTRGAYLLDGNKLGNGTSLFMNEDGGLYPAPIGKYHALKQNHVNYSVPNRAKVPLNIPSNSPLYNLFIEQEKERYRLLMQHIKEREKLTLSAEQEIMRVHNQAALAAANQLEPFSVCTMLKHQEIYNYLDSDGFTILSSDDAQMQDGEPKRDETRTRSRYQEHTSPPSPARKNSSSEEQPQMDSNQKDVIKTTEPPETSDSTHKVGTEQTKEESAKSVRENDAKDDKDESKTEPDPEAPPKESAENGKKKVQVPESEVKSKIETPETAEESETKSNDAVSHNKKKEDEKEEVNDSDNSSLAQTDSSKPVDPPEPQGEASESVSSKNSAGEDHTIDSKVSGKTEPHSAPDRPNQEESKIAPSEKKTENNSQNVPMEENDGAEESEIRAEHLLSDDDRRAYNKEIFLSQLQDIDDKWDKIRGEMLIRHRNEAESLYAVQRLEWEWKTKEIGACDVRTTPIIDNTLVPKLVIHSQDY